MPAGPIRLPFLDGLRGVAALCVLLYHVVLGIDTHGFASSPLARFFAALGFLPLGAASVAVFIVLSGFSLALPLATTGRSLPGGLARFVGRRAWRILPPYYAALIFSVAVPFAVYSVLFLFHHAQHREIANQTLSIPRLSLADLVSHGLLLHNLTSQTNQSINPAMWSVATEWQIYFIFALVLVPALRRFGLLATLALSLVVGIAPHLLLPPQWNLDWARFWYIALFSMGIAAALIAFASPVPIKNWRRLPFLSFAAIFALLAIGAYRSGVAAGAEPSGAAQIWHDLLVGVAACCLILHCVPRVAFPLGKSQPAAERSSVVTGLLASAPARLAGNFSYSLYLTHLPLTYAVGYGVAALHRSPPLQAVLQFVIELPAAIGFAYVFYLLVERPSLRSRRRLDLKSPSAPALLQPA